MKNRDGNFHDEVRFLKKEQFNSVIHATVSRMKNADPDVCLTKPNALYCPQYVHGLKNLLACVYSDNRYPRSYSNSARLHIHETILLPSV